MAPADPREKLSLAAVELVEQDGFCIVRVQPGGTAPPRLKFPHGRFTTAVTTDINANWKAVVEALLADANCQFQWPLAFTVAPEPGFSVMRQIVPRSFSRTRMADLIFAANDAVTDALAACRCRAAGTTAAANAPAAKFLHKLAAACAE